MFHTRLTSEVPTFGIPLRLLCDRSGVEVPLILGDILRWLAAHALAQPDVFAQPSKSVATSQLKCAIDSGILLAELVEGTHPAVVGSLLKRWLEELPDPLLDWDQQVELLSACKDEGCIEARIASLNDAVALIDPISLGTLKPLLLFLQQYCFRQRRFDQQLLQVAVAFAPILFPAALAAGPAELRLAEETVATLVSNALHVFNPTLAANVPVVTPQALCEAAAEVTAMESSQLQQQQEPGLLHQPEQQHQKQAAAAQQHPVQVEGGGKASGPTSCHQQYELVDDVGHVSIDQQRRASQHRQEAPQQQLEAVQREERQPQQQHELTEEKDSSVSADPAAAEATQEDAPYAPYLLDAPFLESFVVMVDSCVTSALFSDGGCSERPMSSSGGGDAVRASQDQAEQKTDAEEEHCGSSGGSSTTSTASTALLSSGGSVSSGCSSGGGSVCSGGGASATTNRRADPHHHQHQHIHSAVATGQRSGQLEGSSDEAPYSPRDVLVNPPRQDEQPVTPGTHNTVAQSGGSGPKASPAASAAATLAELAHREVSEGSVICIISAQPGSGIADNPAGGGSSGAGVKQQAGGAKNPSGVVHAITQEAQALSEPSQPGTLASSSRRPADGGACGAAAATASDPTEQDKHHHQHQVSDQAGSQCSSTCNGTAATSEPLPVQRRMTMGGEGSDGGATPQPRRQPATPGTTASLPSPSSSSSPHVQQHPQHHDHPALPPIAAAQQPNSGSGNTCGGASSCSPAPFIAELGVAGHLRVSLTAAHTLVVRELSTPEALAHRVPVRTLSPAALLSEKDRLKRQLKDVAAAYEARVGQVLVPALKEPLRPVYVRYHKIKALLNSGRAGGPVASQRREGQTHQQQPGPVVRAGGALKQAPLVVSRPGVMA